MQSKHFRDVFKMLLAELEEWLFLLFDIVLHLIPLECVLDHYSNSTFTLWLQWLLKYRCFYQFSLQVLLHEIQQHLPYRYGYLFLNLIRRGCVFDDNIRLFHFFLYFFRRCLIYEQLIVFAYFNGSYKAGVISSHFSFMLLINFSAEDVLYPAFIIKFVFSFEFIFHVCHIWTDILVLL